MMGMTRIALGLGIVVSLALAACSAQGDVEGNNVDGGAGGDANYCGVAITFDPTEPSADPLAPVRAEVNVVGALGVFHYVWTVSFNGNAVPFTYEASDESRIGFIANAAGPYSVTVDITGPVPFGCNDASGVVNVGAPGANVDVYRLRTVPPAGSSAPPQEQIIQVKGGADYVRAIALDSGISTTVTVQQAGSGTAVPGYVKLMPISSPGAFTELFTSPSGQFSAKLLGQTHDVLVIPTSTSIAPAKLAWTPSTTLLQIGAGTVRGGIVRGPGGTGLSGAKVQLLSDGVPSTASTTAADGSFAVRHSYTAGAAVTVKVTPPATSGLPRLEATGAFDLSMPLQINYAASLTTCDLSNTPVRRSGANQASAKVTIVGALPGSSGSVIAGVTVAATGSTRVATVADGTGKLPSILVPRASLSAVVELPTTPPELPDFAVDTIDTSACAAQIIDAPAPLVRTGVAKNVTNAVLSGVRVEATPIGVLALADAQTVSVTTDAAGAFSIALASGGRYDVRFVDPYQRAATLPVPNILPGGVPTTATLPKAIAISGAVSIAGITQPVAGATVQLLCASCTGVAASRPIAETASTNQSQYRLAVPDPGTM
jgi:hypothetical protein